MTARQGGVAFLAARFAEAHAVDAARVLEGLAPGEIMGFLEGLEPGAAAAVLDALGPRLAAACLGGAAPEGTAGLLQHLPAARGTIIMRQLAPDVRPRVLEALPPGLRRRMKRSLRFPAGTAGALADSDVATVAEHLTVGEARKRALRAVADLPYVYVVNNQDVLTGVTTRRELAASPSGEPLRDHMHTTVHRVRAELDLADLASHPAWRKLDIVPVVDRKGAFLGVIRHRTIRNHTAPGRSANRGGGALPAVLGASEAYWTGLIRAMGTLTPPASAGHGRHAGGSHA